MADTQFDLVVIGTGSAAQAAAYRCRRAGWRVAVVDSRPYGGTCANRGCDPKKVLVAAADLVSAAARLHEAGATGAPPRIDWTGLMRFKSSFTDPVPQQTEDSFGTADIETFHGHASFVGDGVVAVDGKRLHTRHALIATGAVPRPLGIPGEELMVTSDQFLSLPQLPKRVVFVGGGYISFEFAHIAARAGAEVTVLQRDQRPLKGFDPDLVDSLVAALRGSGVDVRLQSGVTSLERVGQHIRVAFDKDTGDTADTSGTTDTIDADVVVHGAGRVPAVDGLELDRAGVEVTAAGVTVTPELRSVANSAVFAAGDAAASGGPPLTPIAGLEGAIAAANLLGADPPRSVADYAAIPSMVFTEPPLARVGMLEQDARAAGIPHRVKHEDLSDWFTVRRLGAADGAAKVIVSEDDGLVLGAHLLGPHAETVINLFAMAMQTALTVDQLRRVVFAYPTASSDLPYML